MTRSGKRSTLIGLLFVVLCLALTDRAEAHAPELRLRPAAPAEPVYVQLSPTPCLASQPTEAAEIIHVDSSAFPTIAVSVVGHTATGPVIDGVEEENITLTEQTSDVSVFSLDAPQVTTVCLVLDMKESLGELVVTQLVTDGLDLLTAIFCQQPTDIAPPAVMVAPIVPGDDETLQKDLSVSTSLAQASDSISGIPRPAAATALYTAIKAAIDKPAKPAFVFVLSDGQHRDESVDANTVAQLAKDSDVRVYTLDYSSAGGDAALTQLAETTGGKHFHHPAPEDIAAAAADVREQTSSSVYQLNYTSTLPADGGEYALAVRFPVGDQARNAIANYRPMPWDSAAVVAPLNIHASGYPTITLQMRPTNAARRAPVLETADIQLDLDGSLLDLPDDKIVTLPTQDDGETSAESIALVLDLSGPNVQAVRLQADMLLNNENNKMELKTDVASRIGLFVAGRNAIVNQGGFNRDNNQVRIELVEEDRFKALIPPDAGEEEELGQTFVAAIQAAAHDGETHQRPAYVVFFSDRPLSSVAYGQVREAAIAQHVTVHVIHASAGRADMRATFLAQDTRGLSLTALDQAAIETLFDQIAQQRAPHYQITIPFSRFANQSQATLTVNVGDVKEPITISQFLAGDSQVQLRISYIAQIALGGICFLMLMLVGLAPRIRQRASRLPANAAAQARAGTSITVFEQLGQELLQEVPPEEVGVEQPGDGPSPTTVQLRSHSHQQSSWRPQHTMFWGPLPGAEAAPDDPPPAQQSRRAPSSSDYWGKATATETHFDDATGTSTEQH